MTLDLPRPLDPWRSALAVFPAEIALSIGDVVARLSVLVGPLERESAAARGEPDGVAGIGRRGPWGRLLATEWALLSEVPDEFLRRAAEHELAFYELARREPSADRRSIALFDAGIGQLGGPRIVHLAALVLLSQRATDGGARFAWGVLQDPETVLHETVSAASVMALIKARRATTATTEDALRWSKVLGAAQAGARGERSRPGQDRELWIVGGASSPAPMLPMLGTPHPRIVVEDSLDPGAPNDLDVSILTPRRPPRRARLEIPPPETSVRLLRNPFQAPPKPRPVGIVRLAAGATPFVFASNGKKLFTRTVNGGLLTLHAANAGTPRVMTPGEGESIVGVGRLHRRQRTVVLVRTETGYSMMCLGRRDRGVTWSVPVATPEAFAIEVEPDAPLFEVIPVSRDDSFVRVGERLFRLHIGSKKMSATTHLVVPAHAVFRSEDVAGVVVITADEKPRMLRCWIGGTNMVETQLYGLGPMGVRLAPKPRIFVNRGLVGVELEDRSFRVSAPYRDARATTIASSSEVDVIGVHEAGTGHALVIVDRSRRRIELLGQDGVVKPLFECSSRIIHAQTNTHRPNVAVLTERGDLEIRVLLEGGARLATYEVGGTP